MKRLKIAKLLVPALILTVCAPSALGQVDLIGRYSWIDTDAHEDLEGDPDANPLRLEVDSDSGYGLAVNFFVADQFSIELGASVIEPDVLITETRDQSGALVNRGGIEMIPLTGVVQYHFRPEGPLDFYIGAGVGYVLLDDIPGDRLDDVEFDEIELDEDGGFVVNLGLNYMVSETFGLNLDAKYIPLDSSATAVFADAEVSGADISVNPLILSGGVWFRF